MNRFALMLLPLPLLGACHVDTKNPANGDENVMIKADDKGKVAFDLPFAKGEVKLPEGMMRNGDVDIDGVKLMPGSKVTGFSVMAGEGKESNINIGFSAPKPPAEVSSYFVGEFARQGAQTQVSGNSVVATMKDGDHVMINVDPDGAGSKGMIGIRSKD